MTTDSTGDDGPGCALVTGGSRGIGRAIAVRLAEDGHDVAFCYRGNDAAARETVDLIEKAGRRAHCRALDVARFEDVAAFAAEAADALGPVAVAVACAGITRDRSLALMPPEDWSSVLRTNLDGAFNLARSVVTGMIRRRAGSIVLISSVSGLHGNAGQANYAAAKAGLHGLAGSLCREVGRLGIRVNVVAPGFIESDMVAPLSPAVRRKLEQRIPLGRFGDPRHVADAVSFLASERAAYISGAILRVDGGLSL
jgi:3-oxoacyl-[acyl-carrier protein] reductase